jgi:hypothetical protein
MRYSHSYSVVTDVSSENTNLPETSKTEHKQTSGFFPHIRSRPLELYLRKGIREKKGAKHKPIHPRMQKIELRHTVHLESFHNSYY